jgi:ectoine hydroxylase-related dioxygenase (phytanoyl-CoA dioxygenase family)
MFRCGRCYVLEALTDIGPGDGATMAIPGSHKSNMMHPQMSEYSYGGDKVTQLLPGSVEVNLKKGDALLFVDALMHGGSERTTPGERRVVIYRYGPSWGRTRYGYRYSRELINRLTPERRRILESVPPCEPGDAFIPYEAPVVARRESTT